MDWLGYSWQSFLGNWVGIIGGHLKEGLFFKVKVGSLLRFGGIFKASKKGCFGVRKKYLWPNTWCKTSQTNLFLGGGLFLLKREIYPFFFPELVFKKGVELLF